MLPNSSCTPNFGYFDSPEFLKLALHIVTTISTPAYCLGIYCILFKTPDQMKSVKWNLFILHLWITVFDYSCSLLTVPYLLIPEIAGIPYGLLGLLGVPTSVQAITVMTILMYMIVAILSVYENRFFILCEFRFKNLWTILRKIWLGYHYLIIFLCFLPVYFIIPDQEKAKLEVFKNLPCLPDYIYNGPVFVLLTDFTYPLLLLLPGVSGFVAEFAIFIYFLISSGREQQKSKVMSQKTYQMHKQFFIALILQLTIPICMLSVPLLYGVITVYFNYYNQAAMNFTVIVFTTHGSVATWIMILVHRPYRLAVGELIRRKKRVIRKSTVVSVNLIS